MFKVLLESRALRQRRLGSTIASAAAHGAVIASAVALTLPGRGNATPPLLVADSMITYVAVRPHEPPTPASRMQHRSRSPITPIPRPDFHTIDVSTITLTALPPVDIGPILAPDVIRIGSGSRSGPAIGASDFGPTLGSGDAPNATEVDRVPRVLGRPIEPRYPTPMRASGIEGQLTAEFVVDTLGRAELDGLRFTATTNPLFSESIREALAHYRFVPGEIAGRKVRMRVRIPFAFRLTR